MAKAELEKTLQLNQEIKTSSTQRQNLIHRMQKKLQLVSRERDSYRQQLDSYERDLTICINPANIANPGSNQLQTQKHRIADLEKIIENYKDLVSKLETDLQNAEPLLNSGK